MKKKLFFIICCILIIPQFSNCAEKPQSSIKFFQQERSWYDVCLFLKEIISGYVIVTFLTNEQRLNKASIYCNECNQELNCMQVYGIMINEIHNPKLQTLKQLMRKGSRNRIIKLLLSIQEEQKIICSECNKSYGWHA